MSRAGHPVLFLLSPAPGPVTAIFAEEGVPSEWASYTKKNYAYFEGGEDREVARGRGPA